MERTVNVEALEGGIKRVTVAESVSDADFVRQVGSLLRIRKDLQGQLDRVGGEIAGLLPFCDKVLLGKDGSARLLTAEEMKS